MIIPPAMPPTPAAQTTSANPQQNAALATAATASQRTARPVQAQTARAAAPVGRAEQGRGSQHATFRGRQYDAEAETVEQQSQSRGFRVDVTV